MAELRSRAERAEQSARDRARHAAEVEEWLRRRELADASLQELLDRCAADTTPLKDRADLAALLERYGADACQSKLVQPAGRRWPSW